MSKLAVVQKLEAEQLKNNQTAFAVGDTVRVHIRLIEGEKERTQMFMGTVIARKGSGLSETFSVHRIAYGEGMERVFLLHSPRIAKIEVVKEGDVCRNKLYYLRGKAGKASKVKARIGGKRRVQAVEAKSQDTARQEAEQNVASEEAANVSAE